MMSTILVGRSEYKKKTLFVKKKNGPQRFCFWRGLDKSAEKSIFDYDFRSRKIIVMEIAFVDPTRANLLGYFLRDLLQPRISTAEGQETARQLSGAVAFVAGQMAATVVFQAARIEIVCGPPPKAKARIQGDLNSLLEIALGANYLKYIFNSKIKISGDLRLLLKIVKLFQAELSS
jgi:hypothetical protein